MADTKTSDETAATALDGTELTRIVQGGSSKKTTLAVAGHQFRGARARLNADDTAQDVTTSGGVAIAFDAADFDTDSFWSAGVPSRLTIPAGKGITHVEVTGQVYVSSSTASTYFQCMVRHRNSAGTTLCGYANRNLDKGATEAALSVSTGAVAVSDGDYFELVIQEESDISITIEGDSPFQTFMALTVIGMEPV